MGKLNWIRVNKSLPCRICAHTDWCSISEDGTTVCCMRIESPKPCKSGGWFHELTDDIKPVKKYSIRKTPTKPAEDFYSLAMSYRAKLANIEAVAQKLGVSADSLQRLDIGFDGRNLAFPMRDAQENVIGIRLRADNGQKFCVPGSSTGLFWPMGVYRNSVQTLFICEGPTDCAALLDMGFDAIGRPSCMGGVDLIKQWLKGYWRDVVIMADKDEPKKRPDGSTWLPGQEGAERLAKEIKPLCKSLKVIKPPKHKDIRQWYINGATAQTVMAIIQNTRFVA